MLDTKNTSTKHTHQNAQSRPPATPTMFSLARDDVVAETQTADFDMQSAGASSWRCRWQQPRSPLPVSSDSPTIAALVQAEALPALSLVVSPPDAAETAAFNNSSAMQRLRLQTPCKSDGSSTCWSASEGFVAETPTTAAKSTHARVSAHSSNKRPRSASPASSVSSTASSSCASAAALARKRALKESGCVSGDGGAGDEAADTVTFACDRDDDDELLPRVMSFVEYVRAVRGEVKAAVARGVCDVDYDVPLGGCSGFW